MRIVCLGFNNSIQLITFSKWACVLWGLNLKQSTIHKSKYSSFLNSENASILLNKAENKEGEELEKILELINNQM